MRSVAKIHPKPLPELINDRQPGSVWLMYHLFVTEEAGLAMSKKVSKGSILEYSDQV